MSQGTRADLGFDPEYSSVSISDIGPAILAVFAFFIFAQGLIYLLRPDMTGRSLTISKEKLRRTGIIIVLAGGVILYLAFSWWVSSWSGQPPVDRPEN